MASVKMVGGMGIGIGIWIWMWISMVQLMQVAECGPNTSMKQWRCNVNEFAEGDPYQSYVVNVQSGLSTGTSKSVDYDYYNQSPLHGAVVFGHGTCAITLSFADCDTCMAAAKDAVWDICSHKIGGTVELADCSIRYENYPL